MSANRPAVTGLLGLVATIGLAAAACGLETTAPSGPVRVIGSWTGDELRAFRTVLEVYEARSGQEVEYTETRDLRGLIDQGLRRDEPPDIAGVSGPAHLAELAGAGALRELGDALDLGAYKADVAPTFIDLGTVNGRLHGAFIKSTVKGLIWYDPGTFRLGIPATWDDLQRMAAAAATGVTRPWCLGLASQESSGWPGTDWIETILIRQSGPDVYDAWVAGVHAWSSREVRRAFELFGQVVAEDAVYGGVRGALGTAFASAGDPLFTDPPGCLFLQQGSFMPAFLARSERIAGEDFDFFPFPELNPAHAGSIVGAGDLVALFTDKPAARELMAFLVSPEAQEAWVTTGAALSINVHVADYPTTVSQRAAELLLSADHFRFDGSDEMPAAMSDAFLDAVLDFTADQRRLAEILRELDLVREQAYGGS